MVVWQGPCGGGGGGGDGWCRPNPNPNTLTTWLGTPIEPRASATYQPISDWFHQIVLTWLVCCCSFYNFVTYTVISDGHWLVTVRSHGNFIVIPIGFVCCCFVPGQHLRSYENWYRLVIVCTHGDFIVLPHWETRLVAPWPDIPFSHIILSPSQPVLALSY